MSTGNLGEKGRLESDATTTTTATASMHIGHHNKTLQDGQSFWSSGIGIEVLEKFGVCSLVHILAELGVDDPMTWSTTEIQCSGPNICPHNT